MFTKVKVNQLNVLDPHCCFIHLMNLNCDMVLRVVLALRSTSKHCTNSENLSYLAHIAKCWSIAKPISLELDFL